MSMKMHALAGNCVEDFGLFFEVCTYVAYDRVIHYRIDALLLFIKTTSGNETVALIPGGSNIPVTAENLNAYMHLLASFKMNKEIARQCKAFLSGFRVR
jgi:hypothetical protein